MYIHIIELRVCGHHWLAQLWLFFVCCWFGCVAMSVTEAPPVNKPKDRTEFTEFFPIKRSDQDFPHLEKTSKPTQVWCHTLFSVWYGRAPPSKHQDLSQSLGLGMPHTLFYGFWANSQSQSTLGWRCHFLWTAANNTTGTGPCTAGLRLTACARNNWPWTMHTYFLTGVCIFVGTLQKFLVGISKSTLKK